MACVDIYLGILKSITLCFMNAFNRGEMGYAMMELI